jgi:hypothetical protein
VWADKRIVKKWIREEPMEDTVEGWRHRALCLEAEVSARSAACGVKDDEICILEEGLRQAKEEIAKLKRMLDFRRVTKTAASRSEAD